MIVSVAPQHSRKITNMTVSLYCDIFDIAYLHIIVNGTAQLNRNSAHCRKFKYVSPMDGTE